MHRIDHQTAVGVMPDPKPAGTPGYFGRPNPAQGIPATIVDADWLNMVQGELESVVMAAGIELEKGNNVQLRDALHELYGKIDISRLASDVSDLFANKLDKTINGTAVKYVTETYSDGEGHWWRKWSDGWLEQGGFVKENTDGIHYCNLLLPYRDSFYQTLTSILTGAYFYIGAMPHSQHQFSYEGIGHVAGAPLAPYYFYWQTTGYGA